MPSQNWQSVKLSEITSKIGSGATPRGGKESYKDSGITLIRSLNVYDFYFDYDGLAFIDEKQAKELDNVEVKPKDILLNITGASVARCCIVPEKLLPARVNQHVSIIRTKPEIANPHFVFYTINSPFYKSHLLTLAQGGATREALTKETIEKFEIPLPPLPIQRRIADILSAYDDLIENNTRRIRILEQMAQAIYQEWFGKVDKESLPKGWELVKLGDVADIQWGDTSVTKASYVAEGYIAYSASGADGKLDYYDFDRKGIVLSAIGANCGKTWFAIGKWSCIKNTIRFWSVSEMASTEYLYFVTADINFWTRRGAAQPFISQGDARNIFIVRPDKKTMDSFTGFASNVLEQINLLEKKNTNLRQTRDLLLPRLVSGEIKLN